MPTFPLPFFIGRKLIGILNAVDPNREIDFGFVPCSCRPCERAVETKLFGRAREASLLMQGPRILRSATPAMVVTPAFLLLCASCFSCKINKWGQYRQVLGNHFG